jgi:hypothetical protein
VHEHIRKLCSRASLERDSEKLLELTTRIVELLDQQERKNDQQDAGRTCKSLILREVL